MHANLRSFLDLLRRENDLLAIDAEVDPYLEAAEIHRRVIERGGPALLFTQLKGSEFPVVTNLFGTEKRIELAFGPRPEQFVREIVRAAEALIPPKPSNLWHHRKLAFEFLRLGIRNASRAPVLEVLDQPARLDRLPVLTTWHKDGGLALADSERRRLSLSRGRRAGPAVAGYGFSRRPAGTAGGGSSAIAGKRT